MNYILLGRTLDTIAQEDGYQYCPDDVLQTILDYTGRIDYKPTFVYQIEVKFSYDMWSRRRLYDSSDSEDEEEQKKPRCIAKNKTGYNYYHYCGCCDRFYSSYKSHIGRDKHITNRDYYGDIGKDVNTEVISKTLLKYATSRRHKNTRIKSITMKDIWRIERTKK